MLPATVQMDGVVEMNVTARPDVAVADKGSEVAATWPAEMVAKLMVCVACPMPKLWLTGGAPKYTLLPACVAWMVQKP